ncbi:MAG: methionyl-tRNA formyltransferase [Parahaliea sp.]
MSKHSLRLLFAGTPDFAARHLDALLDSVHEVIGVYTQPDRPAGRGKKLLASPVKQRALAANLPVLQPPSLKSTGAQAELAAFNADVLIVVAYGLILPPPVLATPRLGCLNVHASLLPRWRGAAPIQRAIEAGDAQSGVTIMQMDAGLDTGAMLAEVRCPLTADTNAAALHDTLATIGAPCLLQVLANLEQYQSNARIQDDSLATYAAKIDKQEARIDWRLDAISLDRQVRAFNPFPVCFSERDGQRVKIWQAEALPAELPTTVTAINGVTPGTIVSADKAGIVVACGRGYLRLQTLQLAGGKALSAANLLNARAERFAVGARFEPAAPL